jgi:hypothetical protein
MTDGPESRPAKFSDTFRDCVGGAKDLRSLFVQQKVIVAEVRT